MIAGSAASTYDQNRRPSEIRRQSYCSLDGSYPIRGRRLSTITNPDVVQLSLNNLGNVEECQAEEAVANHNKALQHIDKRLLSSLCVVFKNLLMLISSSPLGRCKL